MTHLPSPRGSVLAALLWLAHVTANVLPPVHVGPAAIPGFAVAADLAALAVLAAVVRVLVVRPMRRCAPGLWRRAA